MQLPVHSQAQHGKGQPVPVGKVSAPSLKITYEIYSGRVSPYFVVDSSAERAEINRRLQGLKPTISRDGNWSGSYIFELLGEKKVTGDWSLSATQVFRYSKKMQVKPILTASFCGNI